MGIYALLLIIAAAIIHAVWNLMIKQVNGGIIFLWLISGLSTLLYLPVLIYQLNKTSIEWTGLLYAFVFGSAVLHLLYYGALQIGYRKADLSVVYPVARGSGPMFSVLGAILIFHERPGILALCGVALIVAGVVIMTGLKLSENKAVAKGVKYGTLTGIFIAGYTLWDKAAVVDHHVSSIFITCGSSALIAILLLPLAIKRREEVKTEVGKYWKKVLIIALLQPLSYLLVLRAMKMAPVTAVAPARELSIVFGVFFGAGLLKEKDMWKRIIAALVILCGIVLLALH